MDPKEVFKAGGAKVISGDAVPPDIKRRLMKPIEHVKDALRRPVPFTRIKTPKWWVYEDERCEIRIPIPRCDVFIAFAREMENVSVDTDPLVAIETLARAFMILHIKPRWYQRTWTPYFDIDTKDAVDFLMNRLRSDVILGALPLALINFYYYVTGQDEEELKKNAEVKGSADTPKE